MVARRSARAAARLPGTGARHCPNLDRQRKLQIFHKAVSQFGSYGSTLNARLKSNGVNVLCFVHGQVRVSGTGLHGHDSCEDAAR